jgi:hypothetical protein
MNKPIQLSDQRVSILKYFAPIIITFIAINWNLTNGFFVPIIIIAGLLYWSVRILPLKSVVLEGEYLVISSFLKKDRVLIKNIKDLNTRGWSMYITRIHFKKPTSFGKTIMFSTMQRGLGTGVSDRVQGVLTQIKEGIE